VATENDPCADQRVVSGPRDLCGFAASGGGFRAALFHVGALRRINELGWLSRIDRFSGASGGSITLGALAHAWPRLRFVEGRATNFEELVERPLLEFTTRRIDMWAALWGLIPGLRSGDWLIRAYRSIVGGGALADLPERPQFTFNASSLQTGVVVRFTRAYVRDYRAGCLPFPRIEVAVAVAASSSFPPYLSPFVLEIPGDGLRGGESPLAQDDYRRRMVLTDGGVYDNLALQTLQSFRTVIASDAGSPGKVDPRPRALLPQQLLRVLTITNEQTRALRRSALVRDFQSGARHGALWTIKTDIGRYPRPLGNPLLAVHPSQIARLAMVPTRLWPFSPDLRRALVNWGYALADAGLRVRLGATGPVPTWPYPDAALERPVRAGSSAPTIDELDEP